MSKWLLFRISALFHLPKGAPVAPGARCIVRIAAYQGKSPHGGGAEGVDSAQRSAAQALFQYQWAGIPFPRAQGEAAFLTEEEQLSLLSSDGMLVKRPLLVGESTVLVGFRPAEWEAAVK